MRVAIVEDEAEVRKQLKAYIERFYETRSLQCVITEFSDGDEILEDYRAAYDLILLDIQMKRVDGMRTAEKIRRLDENVNLVFITNLANYAIKGYSVNAMDFVLKPVNYLMLEQVLERVERLLGKRNRQCITLPTDLGMSRIDVGEILYIETEGHNLIFHTETRTYRTRETMKNMEIQLKDKGFYRCSNYYLVNLEKIKHVTRTSVTVAGQELSISRGKYKELMDALARYIGGIKG